jgi:uncharacterized hydrophobic protein (TIGR00271 family)
MSVAVVFNSQKQAAQVLPWAARFAEAQSTDLVAIIVKRSKGSGKWTDVDLETSDGATEKAIVAQLETLNLSLFKPELDESSTEEKTRRERPSLESASGEAADDQKIPIIVRQFEAADTVTALAEAIATMKIELLVIPKSIDSSQDVSSADWHDKLYRIAPCRTMFLHDDQVRPAARLNVLAIVTDDQDDRAALLTGQRLAQATQGQLTAMLFEPALDQWATEVGDRRLERIVQGELGRHCKDVRQKTILSNSVVDGVRELPASDYDVIVFGSRQRREIDRVMNAVPGIKEGDAPAIAAVRTAIPLTNRVVGRLQNLVQRSVPQLNREQRIELFENVRASSQWNFDFVTMTCLSTLIAALGLIDDSVPVVIGAMLVAPLMTPIVAIGLGLAQENRQLIRSSVKTVSMGFATAFCIGLLTGLVAFLFDSDAVATNEMASRNMPGFVDLMVALVSGIAAAYAMGRPNLMSAIPGVAIAAALVPPLATGGLALALGDFALAGGATLLFLTNMVAIVLAGAIVFWSVGVRSVVTDEKMDHWPRWMMLGLITVTLLLTALFEAWHLLGWSQ